MQEHEAKDLILRHILKNNFEKFVHSSEIKKELFPQQDEQIMNVVFKNLVNSGEYIVKTHIINESVFSFMGYFKATSLTKSFIENDGGFTRQYKENLNRIEKENERRKLETDLAKSNLEANELNKSIATKNDKNETKNTVGMWVNISIGVVNIVLIAIQIWLSSQKP